MRTLFYDTETTGLPLFGEPSDDPRQPHLVQIAAQLVEDETDAVVASFAAIVKPEGWAIPEEAAAVHGITTARALEVGLPIGAVLGMFIALWKRSGQRCGFNESFDARIVRIAIKRHADADLADEWQAGAAVCAARLATPLCRMPATPKMVAARRGGQFKTPKLTEAHEILLGRPMPGAHDAMVDTIGCRDVLRHIRALEARALPA